MWTERPFAADMNVGSLTSGGYVIRSERSIGMGRILPGLAKIDKS